MSRFAFLSGLGASDSRQEFCASEKELNLFVNASERTSLGPARIQIKYVQFQVAAKPGCAEAESVRLGKERPSASSPSVKRRSHDGVRALQCSSMAKDSELIGRHHNLWVARSTSQVGGM